MTEAQAQILKLWSKGHRFSEIADKTGMDRRYVSRVCHNSTSDSARLRGNSQVWACTTCKTERVYGNGIPTGKPEPAMILCDHCQKATKHEFVKVKK